jgi:hypothetical protein
LALKKAHYVYSLLPSTWWEFLLPADTLQPTGHGIQQVLQINTYEVSIVLLCIVFAIASSIEKKNSLARLLKSFLS